MPRTGCDGVPLLKILALGSQQVERGELTPVSEVVKRLRSRATTP
jgi:hypothetical protein